MADLREQVAKAIYAKAMQTISDTTAGNPPMRPWSDRTKYTKDEYRGFADAAIAAMPGAEDLRERVAQAIYFQAAQDVARSLRLAVPDWSDNRDQRAKDQARGFADAALAAMPATTEATSGEGEARVEKKAPDLLDALEASLEAAKARRKATSGEGE
jgi:hypothetical protein